MKEEDGAEAANYAREESCRNIVTEAHGQAGSRQTKKRGEQDHVEVSLCQGEADIVLLFATALRLTTGLRLAFRLLGAQGCSLVSHVSPPLPARPCPVPAWRE